MKKIIIRVPDEMAPLIEAWEEHVPELEIVSSEESGETELDEMDRRMVYALRKLEESGVLRYAYDYAWIMTAIGDGAVNGMGGFRSPQSFMNYLKRLGLRYVPSRTTLSTWFGRVLGIYPRWEFADTHDPQEIMRRMNVVKKFIVLLGSDDFRDES